jgi:hypothetical protein
MRIQQLKRRKTGDGHHGQRKPWETHSLVRRRSIVFDRCSTFSIDIRSFRSLFDCRHCHWWPFGRRLISTTRHTIVMIRSGNDIPLTRRSTIDRFRWIRDDCFQCGWSSDYWMCTSETKQERKRSWWREKMINHFRAGRRSISFDTCQVNSLAVVHGFIVDGCLERGEIEKRYDDNRKWCFTHSLINIRSISDDRGWHWCLNRRWSMSRKRQERKSSRWTAKLMFHSLVRRRSILLDGWSSIRLWMMRVWSTLNI